MLIKKPECELLVGFSTPRIPPHLPLLAAPFYIIIFHHKKQPGLHGGSSEQPARRFSILLILYINIVYK